MVDLYTENKVSPFGKVNKEDLQKWGHNLLVFLAPLGIMYLLQLYAVLQGGTLKWTDLIPTATTTGAIELYLINGALDLLKKFVDGKK